MDRERRFNRFQRKQAYKQKAKREWLTKTTDDSDIPALVDTRAAILSEETVVVLVEEYGYRCWVWKPGITPSQLEKFWAGIESIADNHFFNPSGSLPGEFIEMASVEAQDYWFRLFDAKTHTYYKAHIHWDDDSYLQAPDGRIIKHAGYGRED